MPAVLDAFTFGVRSLRVWRWSKTISSWRSGTSSHLFCKARVERLVGRSGSRTHNDKEVCIAGLHPGRRRRVLVPHEVFGIDNCDNRVHLEITACLTFQLS